MKTVLISHQEYFRAKEIPDTPQIIWEYKLILKGEVMSLFFHTHLSSASCNLLFAINTSLNLFSKLTKHW